MTKILLGTSGWSYDDWVDVFYPSGEVKKLTYYSKVFNTVEIDSTFYSYPKKGLVFGWDRNTPKNFRFSAKLPSVITHEKELDLKKGVEKDMMRFLELMNPLNAKRKLGVILIQLPPSFKKDYRRLEDFLSILPKNLKFAIEFRNKSWWNKNTWILLERYNVANTIVDEPLLPPDTILTADFSFVRWHGKGKRPWYNYRYSIEELKPWIPKLKYVSDNTKEIHGYFNNHFHGYAVQNCLQIIEMLGLINPEQLKVKNHVDRYLEKKLTKKETIVQVTTPEMEKLKLEELITIFTGKERFIRAMGIKDEEVSELKAGKDLIQAKVREYNILIDINNRTILHDCADWARCIPEKKFCKHLGKVLLLMPKEDAIGLLKRVLQERDSWEFKPYA